MSFSLSVVIPALNEALQIENAIQSAWQTGANQVILADGGSQDDTCGIARRLGCEVVTGPVGRGRQQNLGARAAKSEVLLFLHADCSLTPSCGGQVQDVLRDRTDVLAGAFRQQIDAPGAAFRWLEAGNAARVRFRRMPYGDQAIFVRRRVFQQLGGFRDVPLMEDVLLMRQVRTKGHVVLLPGPLHVSARRWQRHGIVGQTLRNWALLTALHFGVSPTRLAELYRRHDQP